MDEKNILYDKQGRIVRLTLNRPEVMNAMDLESINELESCLKKAEADNEVHVVILKGAGKAFCAGFDITPNKEGGYGVEYEVMDDYENITSNIDRGIHTIWKIRKPVIAQVHGYCIAGGNDLVGQCDIVIAAENARFMHPQVRRLGLTFFHMAAYHAGPQWAKMLMFTGDPITGKQAAEIGIAVKSVPDDKLEEEVNKLAARIAQVPLELLQLNKKAINKVFEQMGIEDVFEFAGMLDVIAHTSPPVKHFIRTAQEKGLQQALAESEGPFRKLPKSFMDE